MILSTEVELLQIICLLNLSTGFKKCWFPCFHMKMARTCCNIISLERSNTNIGEYDYLMSVYLQVCTTSPPFRPKSHPHFLLVAIGECLNIPPSLNNISALRCIFFTADISLHMNNAHIMDETQLVGLALSYFSNHDYLVCSVGSKLPFYFQIL